MSPSHHWSCAGHRLSQSADGIVAELDLDVPGRGLGIALQGVSCRLLGLDLFPDEPAPARRAPLVDHWLRGGDVTAVYAPDDARRLRATATWRRHAAPEPVVAWEVVMSAQTEILDSHGPLAVVCELPASDLLAGAAGPGGLLWHPLAGGEPVPSDATCMLARPSTAAGTTVLVAAHPADPHRLAVTGAGGGVRIDCLLFAAPLEKGVLLRSRVLAAFGPAAADASWAAEVVAAFAAAPPPLTT